MKQCKNKMLIAALCMIAISAHAQDSALQAAPGSAPPPQGWTAELPPDSGIHAPSKKKKIKLQLHSADDKAAAPMVSPTP